MASFLQKMAEGRVIIDRNIPIRLLLYCLVEYISIKQIILAVVVLKWLFVLMEGLLLIVLTMLLIVAVSNDC